MRPLVSDQAIDKILRLIYTMIFIGAFVSMMVWKPEWVEAIAYILLCFVCFIALLLLTNG